MEDNANEVELKDGEIKVDVEPSGLKCYVKVSGPTGSGKKVTADDINNELSEHGVIYGIFHERINQIVTEELWDQRCVIAEGIPQVDGVDGKIKYLINIESNKAPVLLEDGRVDFYNLNLINNVHKGDVLAEILPPTDGIPGTSVYGKPIPPKRGKKMVPSLGKNVCISEDGTKIIATEDGEAILDKNKVTVLPTHTVLKDVGPETGNIDFIGNVIVKGNVLSGFHIKAGGRVEIDGAVMGGSVCANGDIIVKQGIQGQNKGLIRSSGNVYARFIENATVDASLNIDGGEAIMHSNINCGSEVVILNRKGVLVGGTIRAGKQVHAKIVGSNLGTVTVIEIGINPHFREELKNILQALPEKEKELDKSIKAINLLKEMETKSGQLAPERQDMLIKLTKNRFQLLHEIDSLRKRKDELEIELENTRHGKLKVKEFIYPGVKVTIGKTTTYIRDPIQHAVLLLEGGEIRTSIY